MTQKQITAVILAGGRGTRLGGVDKGLIKIAGQTLIQHIITAIGPQVNDIIIIANRNQDAYANFGFPVLADLQAGYHGPLAGILTALDYCRTPYLLSMPCDAPRLAQDYATRMIQAIQHTASHACVAQCNKRWQPVHCLMKTSVKDSARKALQQQELAMHRWLESLHAVSVDFSDTPQQFENINTQSDLQQLEQLMTQHDDGL